MKRILYSLLFALSAVTAQAQQTTEAFLNDVAIHASTNFLSIAGAKTGTSADGTDTYYQAKLKPPIGTAHIAANKSLEGFFTWIIPLSKAKQAAADATLLMKNIVAQDSINYYVEDDTDEKGNKAIILYEDDGFEGAPVLSVLNSIDKANASNSQCIITMYGTGPLGEGYLTQDYTTDLNTIVKHATNGFKDIIGREIKTVDAITYFGSKLYPKAGEVTIGVEKSSASRWLAWKTPLALSKKLQADAEAYIKSQYADNPFYEVKTTEDAAKGMKITSVTVLNYPVFEIATIKSAKDLSPDANQFLIMVYETSTPK
ncbi:hypothetical protein DBR32_03095 [Taibaiella sp. KBW10]|uniref:hypothetical protein n=1 Tax=Taibaiella sp. KBW10 TaxID=2153357 RepID=UPI000F5AF09E|nr:hypothetical protein [Taibaiella sp. KBW10]RQO32596.1 hypothetical protein DBR32_03095 [Taibaiella sp. KBW10]